jgi:hypothetical protein
MAGQPCPCSSLQSRFKRKLAHRQGCRPSNDEKNSLLHAFVNLEQRIKRRLGDPGRVPNRSTMGSDSEVCACQKRKPSRHCGLLGCW